MWKDRKYVQFTDLGEVPNRGYYIDLFSDIFPVFMENLRYGSCDTLQKSELDSERSSHLQIPRYVYNVQPLPFITGRK